MIKRIYMFVHLNMYFCESIPDGYLEFVMGSSSMQIEK